MVDGDVWNYVWAHEKKKQEKWIKKIPLKAIPEKGWQRTLGEGVCQESTIFTILPVGHCYYLFSKTASDLAGGQWGPSAVSL